MILIELDISPYEEVSLPLSNRFDLSEHNEARIIALATFVRRSTKFEDRLL